MNQDTIKATGRVRYELRNEHGEIKDTREYDNLVVTVGKTYLAAWLAAASQAGEFMSYVGLGTNNSGPTTGDTGLGSPLATYVVGTLTSSSNIWQNVASFGPGVDTGSITEAGLFSTGAPGTMFARQTFAVINKAAGDTLQVTWQVTFS